MGRREDYRRTLRGLDRASWPEYLAEHSNLPGPRGNLELAHAVADEGDAGVFEALIATEDEYLTFCGVLGLGQCSPRPPNPLLAPCWRSGCTAMPATSAGGCARRWPPACNG